MNINTLTYIHELLRKTEENARTMTDWARQSWYRAEETHGENSDEAKKLRAEFEQLRGKQNAAYDALQDFESHEWR